SHYLRENDTEKARGCLGAALKMDSNQPERWRELGGVGVQLRDWPKANLALEKAYRGKPDNVEWIRDCGLVYAAQGDWENYQRICSEMLDKFGDRKQPRKNRLEVGYLFSQGPLSGPLLEGAMQLGQGLVEEEPRGPKGVFNRAAILYRAEKWEEALR